MSPRGGREPLTRSDVARLQTRPGGGRRIVISYLSIGEAESYRWYWRDSWAGANMPDWQVAENCAWPKAHMVRFWHNGWKDIIYRGASSYLQRIVDAGFDGVYLDRVDIYGFQTKERPSGRADMIDFVAELAAAARKLRPGFLVIPQNADELLADRRYRRVIDGLGREDLINGEHATGGRNKPVEIGTALARLAKLQRDYKPVFVVEYLATQPAIATAEREIRALGMVPTFAHRSLDGDDPTRPRPDEQSQIGTPEWTAANCRDKPHW